MKTSYRFTWMLGVLLLSAVACKKEFQSSEKTDQNNAGPLKVLSKEEQEAVVKFEHASLVLQGVFSKSPALRKEFNSFIAAKLAKSGNDESLSFQEIFEPFTLSLPGVSPDFLFRFRDAFAGTFISGDFPNQSRFADKKFTSVEQVAGYFDIRPKSNVSLDGTGNQNSDQGNGLPYMIYYPYSENWSPEGKINYAVSHHPLVTEHWNYGALYSSQGSFLNDVYIDDDYAFGNPTYIVTYDDGLQQSDFESGNLPFEAKNYAVTISDRNYNPVTYRNQTQSIPYPQNPGCRKELRIRDGRWTLLKEGFGIFEGKIEFAAAMTIDVSQVNIPGQPNSPSILVKRDAHGWGYVGVKRDFIRKMQRNPDAFVHLGIYISYWCEGDPDKMLFIYEYDRPNLFSTNSLEWSQAVAAAANLISNEDQRERVSAFANQGIQPLVQALLNGTTQSRIVHYSLLGASAVIANQRIPTAGIRPSLINGYRPYGSSNACVTLAVD